MNRCTAKARHICARVGSLRLWHNPRRGSWEMRGGKWGGHMIFEPACFNERVAAHWFGYVENNGLSRRDAWPTTA